MITKTQLTLVLALTAVVLAVYLHIEELPFKVIWFKYVPSVVTPLGFILMAFDHVIWKWLPVALVKRPKLAGTWRGVLRSSQKDDESGMEIAPIDCFAAISQRYSTITVRLYTPASQSKSITSRILEDDDVFVLESTYLNTPPLKNQGHSRMHYGTMRLTIVRGDALVLRGPYWTDRGTVGELELVERTKKVVDGHEAAKKLFDEAVKPSTAKTVAS